MVLHSSCAHGFLRHALLVFGVYANIMCFQGTQFNRHVLMFNHFNRHVLIFNFVHLFSNRHVLIFNFVRFSIGAYLRVLNYQGPGQFTRVTLKAGLGDMLVIPEEAVLVSGDKRIVFRDLGDGRLQPQTILTGYSDGEYVIVREGLADGDAIVISGNFLIAAESKLKSGIDQW